MKPHTSLKYHEGFGWRGVTPGAVLAHPVHIVKRSESFEKTKGNVAN